MKKRMAMLLAAATLAGSFSGLAMAEESDTSSDRYEETVTLTSYFEISAAIMDSFQVEDVANSYFTQQQEEQTNIHIDYLWYAAATADDATQKKDLAIASGDIPDFMCVSSSELALLAKTDLINKNIGEIFEEYASDTLKSWIYAEGDKAMNSAMYNGQVIAIPNTDSAYDYAEVLWIRQDWLDKLGLEVPTTMEELYDVMVAFQTQDPDGNGEDDTIGLTLHKDFLSKAMGDAIGLFNGFGAYPASWIQGEDGQLVYGSVQPEVKEALSYLAKMYQEGLIQEDFSALADTDATEASTSGKSGMQYGVQWNAIWPLQTCLDNDPEANWVAISLPCSTGETVTPQINTRINNYMVVSAKCEHPEALIKLLNFWCDAWTSEQEEYDKYLTDYHGAATLQFPQHYVMAKTYYPLQNLTAYWDVKDALETGDTSGLSSEYKTYYDNYVAYKDGDNSYAGTAKTFGPEDSSFEVINNYYQNNTFKWDEFTGASTSTMTQRMSTITDKVLEYYTKVIMGIESVDSFDDFVNEVNNLGLTKITEEVNEWYAAQ